MFHTFTPAEEKIEKKEFESAENIFTTFIVTALAMIGASAASDETKQLAKELVKANCRSVTALEKRGDKMIQHGNNPTDKKLWTDIKDIKENAPCSRGVLAGTTYSGVSPSYIGDTMTREQMLNYIAKEENKKIEEQHAEEEAKEAKVREEYEAQLWMLDLFRNSPSALVNIIEENAKHTTRNTVKQAIFWKQKHEAVEKYLEARQKTKEKNEAVEQYIIDVIFGGAKVFAGAILAVMTIDQIDRWFATRKTVEHEEVTTKKEVTTEKPTEQKKQEDAAERAKLIKLEREKKEEREKESKRREEKRKKKHADKKKEKIKNMRKKFDEQLVNVNDRDDSWDEFDSDAVSSDSDSDSDSDDE